MQMNKKLSYILFLFFISLFPLLAQTLSVEEVVVEMDSLYSSESEPLLREVESYKDTNTFNLPFKVDTNDSIVLKKFTSNFKKKYKESEEFDYNDNRPKDSLWKRFKRALNDALNNFFRQFNVNYKVDNYFTIGMRIMGVAVIVLLLYYIIRAFIQKDIYWLFKKKAKKLEINVEDIEQNIENVNFDLLIEKTITDNAYRLAIRFYYLWLLQRLQEQNHIVWNIEKTNSDYVKEITDSETKAQFQYLSYLYNNIWYGEHDITFEEFSKAKTSFDAILKPK